MDSGVAGSQHATALIQQPPSSPQIGVQMLFSLLSKEIFFFKFCCKIDYKNENENIFYRFIFSF